MSSQSEFLILERMPKSPHEVSELLAAWSTGDEEAFNHLVPIIYEDLRRMARKHLARRGGRQELESGTLVHEAYLKLIHARGIQCEHRAHFFALCAQIIRRILVDHARKHGSAKRGGDCVQVSLDTLASDAVRMLGKREAEVRVYVDAAKRVGERLGVNGRENPAEAALS